MSERRIRLNEVDKREESCAADDHLISQGLEAANYAAIRAMTDATA